ncbi:MAG: sensor histidine kinase [Lachnospiraceae bacterium]|nr:sensor histidine kinase [Lachnospiraceae bacterium]
MFKTLRKLIPYLLTIILISCFCLGLYTWNNKYTHYDLQPRLGQLTITEADLTDYHFLIEDWEFYPDCLLTPETYPGTYMYYTDIGARTRFDSAAHLEDPHGSGSYALHLNLPKQATPYALELPEIYSSYKLYINDVLVAQAGNPNPDEYVPGTQTRLLPFEASGDTTLLLAVTDYSHFYSGLVYPPVFGVFSKVNTLHNVRLGFTLVASTAGLLFALFSFYFGIRMRSRASLLLGLLCLLMCLTPLFPVIHTLWELPVLPWYALELCCIYGMMLLVVLLHNRICDAGYYPRLFSVSIAGGFCLLAGNYGLFASHLTVPVMQAFSKCLFCYKLGFAAYLLIMAGMALRKKNDYSRPVFYGTIGYATVYVWDRILPAFDPILYGWFADWGSLLLVCTIAYTLWSDLVSSYINRIAFEEETRQVKKQLSMLKAYTQTLDEQLAQKRRMTHDFRHQLRTISEALVKLQADPSNTETLNQLQSYIEDVSMHTSSHTALVSGSFSTNPVLNALLNCYYFIAKEQDLQIDLRFHLPEHTPLSVDELTRVLGNLLENAVEACNRLPEGEKGRILLTTYDTGGQWFLMVENTYDSIVYQKSNRLLSRKASQNKRYGVGVESVREVITSHGGKLDIMPMEKLFRVGITIPLMKNP